MELGALVCTAASPRCDDCPVSDRCAWRAAGHPAYDGPPRRGQAWAGTDRQCRGRLMAVLRDAEGPVPARRLDAVWPDAEQRERCLADAGRRRPGRPRPPPTATLLCPSAGLSPSPSPPDFGTSTGPGSSVDRVAERVADLDTGRLERRQVGQLADLLAGERERRGRALALDVDQHDLAGADLAVEHLLGEHVLDLALDRAAQRPGAQDRVEAPLGQQVLGRLGQLDPHVAVAHPQLDRAIMLSTMWTICSCDSGGNTMISSTRLRNSGRKCCLSSSWTLFFIRS